MVDEDVSPPAELLPDTVDGTLNVASGIVHGNVLMGRLFNVMLPYPAPPPKPRQLLPDVSHFIGRDALLAQLDAHTNPADKVETASCLIVIDGTAGVGKTSIAVHWAHRVRSRFVDGELFANLDGYHASAEPARPEAILADFLHALGVRAEELPDGLKARTDLFRSIVFGKSMLMILDNAHSADQIRPLLPGDSSPIVLVTSRDTLGGLVAREGATRMTVPGLPVDEAIELLKSILGSARVEAERPVVVELIYRCAQLPLALRIFAERASSRPKSSLAELMAEVSIASLSSEGDQSAAMRDVLSWSYRALPVPAARVFRLCGLHPTGEFSSAAMAALDEIPVAEAREQLNILRRRHLIDEIAPDRYRQHDLLRAYATELVQETPASTRQSMQYALQKWYLERVIIADAMLRPIPTTLKASVVPDSPPTTAPPFQTQVSALAWCEEERANLMAVVRQAQLEHHDDIAWRLPVKLWGFFHIRSYWDDWTASLEIALRSARRLGDPAAEATVLNNLGRSYVERNLLTQAMRHFTDALDINDQTGDAAGRSDTLNNLGYARALQGHPAEAIENYVEALEIRRLNGNRWGEGWTLNNLGLAYATLGLHDDAITYYHESLAVRNEIGDAWGKSWTHTNLGITLLEQGSFADAIASFEEALTTAEQLEERWGTARALANLGKTLQTTGRLAEARRCFTEALALYEEIGDPQAEQLRHLLSPVDETESRPEVT